MEQWYFIVFLLFVFGLVERKNEQQVGCTLLPQAKALLCLLFVFRFALYQRKTKQR